jgi:serine/threonine-protein kinase
VTDALIGQTVAGRYRIDAQVGAGGMGSVYRAHQLVLETDVAVKVLSAERASDADSLERFRREAKHASKLDHPNLVAVTDFGQMDDGRVYLVMPLIEGKELAIEAGEPFEPEYAAEIAAQILDGLSFAHALGLVHRDLKPENVILQTTPQGDERIRLLDFGIALNSSAGANQARLTKANFVYGTPLYMSPEQAGGGKVDGRSDQYSVGIILYQMLSGRLPFESSSPADILRMHLVEPPPPLPDTVPEALASVVLKMLGKSRRERFDDSESAAKALRESLKPGAVAHPLPMAAASTVASTAAVSPDTQATPLQVAAPIEERSESKRPLAFFLAPLVAIVFGAGLWFATSGPDEDEGTPLPDLVEPEALPEPPPVGGKDQPEPAAKKKKKKSKRPRVPGPDTKDSGSKDPGTALPTLESEGNAAQAGAGDGSPGSGAEGRPSGSSKPEPRSADDAPSAEPAPSEAEKPDPVDDSAEAEPVKGKGKGKGKGRKKKKKRGKKDD